MYKRFTAKWMEWEGPIAWAAQSPGSESIPLLITEASKIHRLRNIH